MFVCSAAAESSLAGPLPALRQSASAGGRTKSGAVGMARMRGPRNQPDRRAVSVR